jgi:hypothetical protein
MDELYSHGFQSSFMQHHLVNTPNVSAIPPVSVTLLPSNNGKEANHKIDEQPNLIANLPTDGPEVDFRSRVNRSDTVVAHVNTGATVMVSNVHGEIHGAIPTTAHCGTAMTGSRATIDALGTWMVDLVGSVNGKGLPLALRGTTQITDFQQRSLSLHALKELGFDCAHILTQEGNFLEIVSSGTKHRFL